MAWNGSGRGGASAAPKTPAKVKNHLALGKGALAGVVVVLIGVLVFCFLRPSAPQTVVENAPIKKTGITEVKPSVVEVQRPEVKEPKKLPYWEQPTTNGLNEAQLRKWKFMHQEKPSWTNTVAATRPKPRYAIFPTHVENEIACLMTMKPGTGLVGTPKYSSKINDEFIKSCEVPIIVSKDDDEYSAQLKREMNQVKIELRQRIADGEDLGKILLDSRKEMQRLAQLKREVESATRDMIRQDAMSEDEADRYIEAANRILQEKGIAPMELNPISKRALVRSVKEER